MIAGDTLRRKRDGQLVKVIHAGPRGRVWCEWHEDGFYHDAIYDATDLAAESVTAEPSQWQAAKPSGFGSGGFVE